jgi:23S rRNA-/tRNA-specific pseudouridylate synthase
MEHATTATEGAEEASAAAAPAATPSAPSSAAALPAEVAAATAPEVEAAAVGQKRKADKLAKRAAAKAAKKQKRAEFVRAQLQMRQDGEDDAGDDAEDGAAIGSAPRQQLGAQKRQGQVTSATHHETSYVFRDGFRIALPFWFEFSTYAKRRWLGRELVEVLKGEYGNGGTGLAEEETEEYYRAAIVSGAFRINGARVSLSYRVRDGDRLQHYLHRHETAVSDAPLLVRFEDANMMILDKPSSIPVHPCGNYRHNTVLHILSSERRGHIDRVFIVHRLDAVTSGLLLLAKDARTARQLSQHISDKHVRKEYVARVQGRVPEAWNEHVCAAPIFQYTFVGRTLLSTTPPTTTAVAVTSGEAASAITAAAASSSPAASPDGSSSAGKPSVTSFTFLGYDAASDTSLVRCCPLTGRTHQIRLHLAHLGFPISNDVRYGGRDASTSQPNEHLGVRPRVMAQSDSAAASNGSESAWPASVPAGPHYSAEHYWADPEARKRLLANESETERLRRIEAEAFDESGSCPICAKAAQKAETTSEDAGGLVASLAASAAPAAAATDAADAAAPSSSDPFSSAFSSTRLRVERIYLHAYKYSYDPSFRMQCGGEEGDDAEIGAPADGAPSAAEKRTDASASDSVPAASASASPAPAAVPTWSYEIPWPSWAIEIAPAELRQVHQQVRVQNNSAAVAPSPPASSATSAAAAETASDAMA